MEIPESIRPYLKDHNAFLLENHGALTVGTDVFKTYYYMESMELFAQINMVARLLGGAKSISEENVKKIFDIRENWGLDPHYPGCRIDGKMVSRDSVSSSSDERISISKEELVQVISSIVSKIVNNK